MSANIYWTPSAQGKDLGVWAPSSWMAAMEEALGRSFPMTVTASDVPVLRGIAAAIGGEDAAATRRLISNIDMFGAVELRAEW